MAIGTARLFGIKLSTNFRLPFFARDMREFWQRWHISLTRWFTEYVYLPLGGSRKGKWRTQVHVMIVFVLSGLWHGAGWNFVLWGAMHGLLLVGINLFRVRKNNREHVAEGRWFPTALETWQMFRTFGLFAVSMIFFRLPDLGQIQSVFAQLLGLNPGQQSAYRVLQVADIDRLEARVFAFSLVAIFLIEWASRLPQVRHVYRRQPVLRHVTYVAGCCIVFLMTRPGAGQTFIYFQF